MSSKISSFDLFSITKRNEGLLLLYYAFLLLYLKIEHFSQLAISHGSNAETLSKTQALQTKIQIKRFQGFAAAI